mmetsp:Transcript_37609/g.88504  ORF Transcript_37609/g.88504 Transcript_37609/m.88504 type:complete len:773 (+) Transcript_37609:118-2436(+)
MGDITQDDVKVVVDGRRHPPPLNINPSSALRPPSPQSPAQEDGKKSDDSAGAQNVLPSEEDKQAGARAAWNRASSKILANKKSSPEADKAKKPDEHHPDAGSRWKEVLRRTGGFSFKDKDKPGNPGKAPAAPAKPTKKEGEAQTHVETFAALNPIKSLLSDMCALGDFTYAEVWVRPMAPPRTPGHNTGGGRRNSVFAWLPKPGGRRTSTMQVRSEREDGITISQEPAPVTPESASSPKRMLPGLLGPDGMPIADEPDAAVLAAEGDGEQRKDESEAMPASTLDHITTVDVAAASQQGLLPATEPTDTQQRLSAQQGSVMSRLQSRLFSMGSFVVPPSGERDAYEMQQNRGEGDLEQGGAEGREEAGPEYGLGLLSGVVGPLADHLELSTSNFTQHIHLQEERVAQEALLDFAKMGEDGLRWKKGEGAPGLAWAHRELLWHDLAAVPHDDERLSEWPRFAAGKKLFQLSVGIPVVHRDARHVTAVIMLYRAGDAKGEEASGVFRRLRADTRLGTLLQMGATLMASTLETQREAFEWMTALGDTAGMTRTESAAEMGLRIVADATKPDPKKESGWGARYLQKFKGQKLQPPAGQSCKASGIVLVGVFLSVLLMSGIDKLVEDEEYRQQPLFTRMASFAAVAAMLFSAPTSFFVQPRNIFGAHMIAATTALVVDHFTIEDDFVRQYTDLHVDGIPKWVAVAVVPAIASALMAKLGLIHPPAAACSVIYIAGNARVKALGWLFLAMPVLLNCSVCLFVGCFVSNLSRDRSFPQYW